MKIVESSGRLHLYGDDMKAYDQIPAGTYDICFSKMTGFIWFVVLTWRLMKRCMVSLRKRLRR